MKLENRESLKMQRAIAKEAMSAPAHRILVCAGTGCLAGGSAKIYDKFLELAAKEEGVEIKFSAKPTLPFYLASIIRKLPVQA